MLSPGPTPHVVQARRRTLTMVLLITVAVLFAILAADVLTAILDPRTRAAR